LPSATIHVVEVRLLTVGVFLQLLCAVALSHLEPLLEESEDLPLLSYELPPSPSLTEFDRPPLLV